MNASSLFSFANMFEMLGVVCVVLNVGVLLYTSCVHGLPFMFF